MEEMSFCEGVQCASSQEPVGSKAKFKPKLPWLWEQMLCLQQHRKGWWGGDGVHPLGSPVQTQLGSGQLCAFGHRTVSCDSRIWAKWTVGLSSRVLCSSGQSGKAGLNPADGWSVSAIHFSSLQSWSSDYGGNAHVIEVLETGWWLNRHLYKEHEKTSTGYLTSGKLV